jgi:hypothetical protein
VQLSRKVRIQAGERRFRAPRRCDIPDGRVGKRETVPRRRAIGGKAQRLGECVYGKMLRLRRSVI